MWKLVLLAALSWGADKIVMNTDKVNFVYFDTLKKAERESYVLDFESVAKISVPRVNFTDLIPTKTLIRGDVLFISYFALGEETLGAIDIVDIKDPKKPKMISSLSFTDLEFVDMKISGNLLFLAGQKADDGAAVSVINIATLAKPQLLKTLVLPGYYAVKIQLDSSMVTAYTETKGGKFEYTYLQTPEGVDLTFKSRNLGVLSGKNLTTMGTKKIMTSTKSGIIEIEDGNLKKNIKLPGLTMESIIQGELMYLGQADGSLWVLDVKKNREVGFLKIKNKFVTTNALSLKKINDEENILAISEKDGVRLVLETHF